LTQKKTEEKISRRKFVKYAGAGAVVVAAGAAGAYYLTQPPPTPTQTGTTASTGTMAATTTGAVSASTPSDTLVIGTNETPLFIEPATVSYYIDYMVTHMMFQGLLEFKRDTSQIVFEPRLAADFPDIGGSPKGTEYTFKIRQDQKILFHDGTTLDAHAVEYSWKRIVRLGTGSSYFYQGQFSDIKALDDWTIKFTLPSAVAPTVMYAKFASDCGYIVSPTAAEKYGDSGFNNNPVGTGPWKFDHWTQGTELGLVRNDNYWEPDGPAKLKSVLWKQYGDPTTIGLALKNGEIDVGGRYFPIPDIPPLKADSNLQDLSSSFPWIRYLVLNPGTSAPLQNIYNRKAIAYAIDWDNIIKVAYEGQANRLYSHLNPSFPDYIPAQQQYKYDPDMAKQMLAKAGNPNGFTTAIWYTPDYGPEEALVATQIQQYLNAVGITTAVSFAPKAGFISMVRGGAMLGGGGVKGLCPMPIFQYGWVPDYWSPDNYYGPFIYPGTYIAGYSGFSTVDNPNTQAKTMLDNYRVSFDPAQATKISQDVQNFIADQCDVIDYLYPIDAWYGWKNIQGWVWPGVYNNIDFRKVYKA